MQLPDRSLPLLTPMSEVAGRMSAQIGAEFLQKVKGGMGILLGGVQGYLKHVYQSLVEDKLVQMLLRLHLV